ncbi:MAG: molybdopterin molybdotransferase MoeA [Bacteroidetes bacterium]|nr:molybdopterin molybdotransferase MoeA [Bacteroidota bacterium]
MISVKEAKELVEKKSSRSKSITMRTKDALGFVLAEDLFSPIDSPPFHQSAMDGYAFCFADIESQSTLILQGTIQAGDTQRYQLEVGYCFRIFTGAPLPMNADTVIMQEHIAINGDKISLLQIPTQGQNVRLQGSQTKIGERILEKGKLMNAGIIGYVISLGIHTMQVYAKAKVSILVTGKELVQAGEDLQFGQIYESNSSMLAALLDEVGITPQEIKFVDDDLQASTQSISNVLKHCDVLLISGGISVGDYDFVQAALEANKVEKIFYKVKQKPGKPLYFGSKGNKLVFALPGNPAAVLTCFYEYVVLCLSILGGMDFQGNRKLMLPLLNTYNKKGELTHFLKGKIQEQGVLILDGQESYKLQAFTEADCLVLIEDNINNCHVGDVVEVHSFARSW